MEQILVQSIQVADTSRKTEVTRKMIHMMFAGAPVLFTYNRIMTLSLLVAFIIMYLGFELIRQTGKRVGFYSEVVEAATRGSEKNGIVWGPATLALGVTLALFIFPPAVATAAVFAVALGDGTASLAGKLWGRSRPVILLGKSVEGSLSCFLAAFFSSLTVLKDIRLAFILAFTATIVEVLPLGKLDNILIPLVSGAAVLAATVLI